MAVRIDFQKNLASFLKDESSQRSQQKSVNQRDLLIVYQKLSG